MEKPAGFCYNGLAVHGIIVFLYYDAVYLRFSESLMNRNELISLLFQNLESITVLQAVFNLVVAFLCTVIIYAVYVFTSKDVKPTAAFAKTILIVALSVTLVVMLIGSNLALSLGMVGALSIIRFRAAVKDSRDAAFIFYSITAGMASALGVYMFALMGTLFIGLTVIIFSLLNIGSRTYLFTVRTCIITAAVEDEIRRTAGKRYSIVAMASKYDKVKNAASIETVYEIGLKEGAGMLCGRLLEKEGVESVNAVLREDA